MKKRPFFKVTMLWHASNFVQKNKSTLKTFPSPSQVFSQAPSQILSQEQSQAAG